MLKSASSTSHRPALGFTDESDYGRVRELFTSAGFTGEGMGRKLGRSQFGALKQHDLAAMMYKTDSGEGGDWLLRLFLMGVDVERPDAEKALKPVGLDRWIEAGLIEARPGDCVRGAVKLLPLADCWLAYDHSDPRLGVQRTDYVMGVGSSSMTLASATPRQKIGRFLDMGTGCGVHALMARGHCDEVVATDLNQRAVDFTAFAAKLAGAGHVKAVAGSLFEPVEGVKFDLIVSNPPFVISPGAKFIYRDGGMKGDEFCQTLIRQAPGYLVDDGFCILLCNWATLRGQDWKERVAGWFERLGCDCWVMHQETQDAATYASTWIRHTEGPAAAESGDRFREWMEYYRTEGIEAVSAGVIVMRKAGGRVPWFRAEDSPPIQGQVGQDIVMLFDHQNFLLGSSDQELLGARLRLNPASRVQQNYKPSEDGWELTDCEVSRTHGLGFKGRLDTYMLGLMAGCDGQATVGQLIEGMARMLEQPAERITVPAVSILRKLIQQGFLLPG